MIVAARNATLLGWYEANRRDLPWRRSSDPYEVLVSEVMLQQTQVDRVVPKFEQFMDMWPTIEALAAAQTDDLMFSWSGLGYNSRALRLRESARLVASSGWPDTIPALMELPGVGPYTAAAVGSISFGLDVPAIDTNLKRVLSRWAGEPLTGANLDRFAGDCLDSPAGQWNQALMDLGSTLCTPRNPNCGVCPVGDWCIDPTVYDPPPRQSKFEGSHRQLRGTLLRAHLQGEDLVSAGQRLGRSTEEIETAERDLKAEGLIEPIRST